MGKRTNEQKVVLGEQQTKSLCKSNRRKKFLRMGQPSLYELILVWSTMTAIKKITKIENMTRRNPLKKERLKIEVKAVSSCKWARDLAVLTSIPRLHQL